MSETKWTPGEWSFSLALPRVVDEEGKLIADCDTQNRTNEEDDYNSNLISAAPDLYEALFNATSLLSAFSGPDDEISQTALKEARAALAKARGEKPDAS